MDYKACALNFSGGEGHETAHAFPMPEVLRYFQLLLADPDAGLVGKDDAVFKD